MTTVLASAADARYGYHLLNMLGSVQTNSDIFDEIVVHDLGLTSEQRTLIANIRGVELRTVPAFVPHWAQGFTWKPWIWTHVEADTVVYLDAGATVLRRLDAVLEQIEERGYFVVSQSAPVRALVPVEWYDLYGVDPTAADRVSIAAGILGFPTSGRFWDEVVVPTYEDCLAGRSLGFSPAEADRLNYGLGTMEHVVLRDAELFRHDQSVLNMHFLRAYPEPFVNDVYEFGGWRSPRDHPRQVIWNHRRSGDYRYVARPRYASWRSRAEGMRLAMGLRTVFWLRHQRRFLQRSVYVRAAQRLGRRATSTARAS